MADYSFKRYDTKARWASYWHQIDEVLALQPISVLEVGTGNKVVSTYLKNAGIKLSTLDINEKLKPDVVGTVLKMPLQDNAFDVVLCCQVLEHLPFNDFEKGLLELKRVSKKFVILSLPHFGPPIKFCLKIPCFKEKQFALKIPFPKSHKFNGEHYWEIGKRGYGLAKIKEILQKHFKIKKDFIPFEHQYHHFFVLQKY